MGGCGWLDIPTPLAIFFPPAMLLPATVLRYVKVGFRPLVLQRSTQNSYKHVSCEFHRLNVSYSTLYAA